MPYDPDKYFDINEFPIKIITSCMRCGLSSRENAFVYEHLDPAKRDCAGKSHHRMDGKPCGGRLLITEVGKGSW